MGCRSWSGGLCISRYSRAGLVMKWMFTSSIRHMYKTSFQNFTVDISAPCYRIALAAEARSCDLKLLQHSIAFSRSTSTSLMSGHHKDIQLTSPGDRLEERLYERLMFVCSTLSEWHKRCRFQEHHAPLNSVQMQPNHSSPPSFFSIFCRSLASCISMTLFTSAVLRISSTAPA